MSLRTLDQLRIDYLSAEVGVSSWISIARRNIKGSIAARDAAIVATGAKPSDSMVILRDPFDVGRVGVKAVEAEQLLPFLNLFEL